MRLRPLRTWWLLAVAVTVVALGLAGGTQAGTHRLMAAHTAGVCGHTDAVDPLAAVLRTEADRLEGALSGKSSSAARLLLLLAVSLVGLALHLLPAPRGPRLDPGDPPSLARLRQWVGLRAPPSPRLVSLRP